MKSVLISIHPKWCGLIASGEKTIEVRKTRPKISPPFKCYIYCTKTGYKSKSNKNDVLMPSTYGKVIGEFICNKIDRYTDEVFNSCSMEDYSGWNDFELEKACIHPDDLEKYADGNDLYGYHISDLQIYDEPKELPRFLVPGECTECKRPCYWFTKGSLWGTGECDIEGSGLKPLTRPPQSWCYVEELK